MGSPALRALPGSNMHREFLDDKASMAATLARWEEPVELVDVTAARPLCIPAV